MTTFTVPGPPVPWARARRAGNRYFVDAKTAEYKQKIAHAARLAGVKCIHQPHAVQFTCYFFLHRPKKSGEFPTRRPDIDNYAKGALDALNPSRTASKIKKALAGIAWDDDSQVVTLIAHKRYADDDDPVGTRIEIERIDA